MKLKDMPIEELELLSYADLTYKMLKENNKPMNTAQLFKEICALLDLSESEFAAKIGDYYTSLTLDKRFILLKSNEWDIRDNHSVEIVIDEDEEEETEELEEETEELEEETDSLDDESLDDDLDDDLDDLSIIDDDELEEE